MGYLRRGLIRSCRPRSGVWVTRGKGLIAGCSTDDNSFFQLSSSTSTMSVSLLPSSTLGFPSTYSILFFSRAFALSSDLTLPVSGPLTQTVKRTLTISNNNVHPVAFKVKTTAPKVCLYFRVTSTRPEVVYAFRDDPSAVLCEAKFRSGGAW